MMWVAGSGNRKSCDHVVPAPSHHHPEPPWSATFKNKLYRSNYLLKTTLFSSSKFRTSGTESATVLLAWNADWSLCQKSVNVAGISSYVREQYRRYQDMALSAEYIRYCYSI
jgi:hypothetical protein